MSVTIIDEEPRRRYVATAGQTTFSIPFNFFLPQDLKVYRNGELLAYSPSPVDITEFSTTGGNGATGTFTLGAGATLSDDILVYQDQPVEIVADFPPSGPFDVEALNRTLAKMVLMTQHLEDDIDRRILRIDHTDFPETLSPIPVKAERAGKLLGFDTLGQPDAVTGNVDIDQSVEDAEAAAAAAEAAAAAALAAQVAAEQALAQTLQVYDNFDDRYLGSKPSDPTLDNDGNPLVGGALYFNSTVGEMRVYTGSAWVPAASAGGSFLPLAGGTMTGPLILAADPTIALHAATKAYVDLFLRLTGGTLTGRLNFVAADNSQASFRINPGTQPSSPSNGDAYLTASGLFIRIGGAWVEFSQVGHTHVQSDITGLVAELAGKADLEHTHDISEINGFGQRVFSLRSIAGTANAITASTGFGLPGLGEHDQFWFQPAANNTGAATIAIDGLSAVPIVSPTGAALAADEIHTARYYGLIAVGSPVTSLRILAGF